MILDYKLYCAKINRQKSMNFNDFGGFVYGAPSENRTHDKHIRSVLLYPLSYWCMIYIFIS